MSIAIAPDIEVDLLCNSCGWQGHKTVSVVGWYPIRLEKQVCPQCGKTIFFNDTGDSKRKKEFRIEKKKKQIVIDEANRLKREDAYFKKNGFEVINSADLVATPQGERRKNDSKGSVVPIRRLRS